MKPMQRPATEIPDHSKLTPRLTPVPTMPGLAVCAVKIREVKAEANGYDDALSVEVKFAVRNDTKESWEYFEFRTQLLSSSGQILEEEFEKKEEALEPGVSLDFLAYFSGIKKNLFGTDVENAQVVVHVSACRCGQQSLGKIAIPTEPFLVTPLGPAKIENALELVSGCLWKTAPNEEQDTTIELRALVQNLTTLHLPMVNLIAKVTDKMGRELMNLGRDYEVSPSLVCVISDNGEAKERRFKDAQIQIALMVCWPVATGMARHVGMILSTQPS